MNANFPRWYRSMELTSDSAIHQSRWNAAVVVSKAATLADIDALIRITFRVREPSPEPRQRIQGLFEKADDSFQARGADREFEVLCGASLVALFEETSMVGGAAALAVSTTSVRGKRKAHVPMDLIAIAEESIAQRAEVSRARRPKPKLGDTPKVDVTAAQAKAREQHSAEHVALALGLTMDAVTNALKSVLSKTQQAVDEMHSRLQVQDEELEMLWWLIGGRSWDLQCPFNEVPRDAAPLVNSAELAKLTRTLPGPTAVAALLARSGIASDETTVPQAVNATSSTWAQAMLKGVRQSSVIHPIHFALMRREETGEATAWIPGWAATAQLDSTLQLPSLDLAHQFYRERILLLLARE